jgi:hypothetical protein
LNSGFGTARQVLYHFSHAPEQLFKIEERQLFPIANLCSPKKKKKKKNVWSQQE